MSCERRACCSPGLARGMTTQTELLPGLWVDVHTTVHEYCVRDGLAYRYFDLIEPGTDPDDLAPADVWIANNLNARVQLAEFAAIWGRVEAHRDAVKEALRAVPVRAAMSGADDAVVQAAGTLLDLLCGPRAHGSRITKILHKKRPDLFPIIDARVQPLFDAVVPPVTERSWSEYFAEVVGAIGPWVDRNARVLDEAREGFPALSRLRAYDICLWRSAGAVVPIAEVDDV